MNLMLLLIATILCTSLSQVLQKRLSLTLLARKSNAVNGVSDSTEIDNGSSSDQGETDSNRPNDAQISSFGLLFLLIHGVFWLVVGLVLWFFVLAEMEVSRAYPLLSLNVVVVLLLSVVLFDDKVNVQQVVGILSILSGVFLLSAGITP